jgi:hypothetical protein
MMIINIFSLFAGDVVTLDPFELLLTLSRSCLRYYYFHPVKLLLEIVDHDLINIDLPDCLFTLATGGL